MAQEKEKQKARENKNRTGPERFLLQPHTPEEKRLNNGSTDFPRHRHELHAAGCGYAAETNATGRVK